MTAEFDYDAPAELYPSKRGGSRAKVVSYKRFDSAGAAIQFAIEQLDPERLSGAVLEVNEDRFDEAAIRGLYASDDYPLPRHRQNREVSKN